MKFLSPNRYASRLCLLLAMVYFTSYITRLNYNAAMAAILEEGVLTKTQAGGIGSALFFTYGFGQLISGALGDRFYPQHIMTVGLGLTASCNLLMPLASENVFMTVIWGVNGFAQALMWPPIVKLMASYLNEREYATCNWLVSTASHSATILIYIAVPVCITWLNWRAAFFISAILAIVCMMVWLFGFGAISGKLTDPCAEITLKHERREHQKEEPSSRSSLGRAFVTSGTLMILIAIAMQGFLKDGVQSWMPIFFTEVFQMASSTAILSNILLPIFNILVVSLATWLYQRVFRQEVREAMTFFACSVVLCILLGFFYQNSAILCLILAAVITGSMHGINLMFISFLPRRFAATGKVATVSGICNSCSYVGSCISSYGIALIAEKLGWQTTLFSWAGVALIGVLLCLLVYRKWNAFIRENP